MCQAPFIIREMHIKISKTSLLTLSNGYNKNTDSKLFDKDVDEPEFSYITNGNVKFSNHFRKHFDGYF